VVELVVVVVNHGSYSITKVEVRFSYDGKSLASHRKHERMSSSADLHPGLRKQGDRARELAMLGVLSPWDPGIRFESDEVHVQNLKGRYAVVRWTDWWGTRWEHRRGEVREVRDDEEWTP
jgi:hypothetical protein